MTWVEHNLALLRGEFPDLEHRLSDDGINWVRLPGCAMPADLWDPSTADIAFRIQTSAGEAPYAFWAYPQLRLLSGAEINNHSYPVATAWGDGWAQFSFSPSEPWRPKADIRLGPNMLRYAHGIFARLAEGA